MYETRDGKYVAIGANETRFYRNAVKLLGLDESQLPDQHDRAGWPEMKRQFAAAFRARTRDEWAALAKGTETCITPVLSMGEAPHHAHLERRNTFVEVDGVVQPAPTPRFSRTPGAIQRPPAEPGQHTDEVLGEWGFSAAELRELHAVGAIR